MVKHSSKSVTLEAASGYVARSITLMDRDYQMVDLLRLIYATKKLTPKPEALWDKALHPYAARIKEGSRSPGSA